MLVSLNIAGGSYEHKSRPLISQVTRNFWPQILPIDKGRSKYILQSFYGLKSFKNSSGNIDRGMLVNQGKLYKVTDTTLYSVDNTGTHTALGTIPGSERCMLKAMGAQVIIANGGGKIYVWDGTTLTQNTNINLGNPRSVSVLNNQAIYDDGSGQSFDVSDSGQPSSIGGLSYAAAESFSDNLLMTYAWKEILYLMGENTIELWWNTLQGSPPFDKIQGGVINTGIGAIHSVADIPDYMFFLGTDNQFHALSPGSSIADNIISTPAMAKEINDYLVTSDCIGWTMSIEGQWFYVVTFPTQDVTWVLPIGGEWFQWGTGDGRIRANSYARFFNKHLVADYASGNIYELDADTYDDVGESINRVRDTAPIHPGLVGQDNKEFEINSLEVVLETGNGLISGQGSDPRIMVSVSRDGGKSFGTERMLRVGSLGEIVRVRTGSFGRFKSECVLRFRVSDPIYWAIYSANIDMEICI